jgi:hypothetical protein
MTLAHKHPKLAPQQMYIEFHLDYDVGGARGAHKLTSLKPEESFVGYNLRTFFDELFVKGGYVIMHRVGNIRIINVSLCIHVYT